jgi:hypothetical protein
MLIFHIQYELTELKHGTLEVTFLILITIGTKISLNAADTVSN